MTTAVTSAVQLDDTIVAAATPNGRGALALIRLSGRDAFSIAAKHLRPLPSQPRVSQLCSVHDGEEILDQALVTLFPGPNSFTGEDTVELSTHGGYLVPDSVIAALISSGARQASPGEFTRRAVLNSKLDILQAEAIGDLIDARSQAMRRTALGQLDGGLSRRLLQLRSSLIDLEALIVYDIDFPEEDDGPVSREKVQRAGAKIAQSLKALLATAPMGELVREGAIVVIAGPPNAGKSSLFNALLGRSRAIVTELPGTTRDALEAVIDTGEWPLRLVDTAGLRDTDDRLERLGIEVSERYLADAQVVIACGETPAGLENTMTQIAQTSHASILPVHTKIDLVSQGDESVWPRSTLAVSAETGAGLVDLLEAINEVLRKEHGEVAPDVPILTRARHRHALSLACSELELFQQAWDENSLPATVASVHLRTAVLALEELIGTVEIEDVFDRVFSSFCVGK